MNHSQQLTSFYFLHIYTLRWFPTNGLWADFFSLHFFSQSFTC